MVVEEEEEVEVEVEAEVEVERRGTVAEMKGEDGVTMEVEAEEASSMKKWSSCAISFGSTIGRAGTSCEDEEEEEEETVIVVEEVEVEVGTTMLVTHATSSINPLASELSEEWEPSVASDSE